MRRIPILSAIAGFAAVAAAPAAAQQVDAGVPADDAVTAPADPGPAVPDGGGPSGRATYITPYIEVSQELNADLTTGDVLTYTQLGAGVDAGIQTRRAQAQISYRYERDIFYQHDNGDEDVNEGLARAAVAIVPGLSVEGGALATRSRSDIRGADPIIFDGDSDNVSQVYALYAGPTLGTHVGPLGVSASYRYAYTKVTEPYDDYVAAGQPRLDNYDSSNSHQLQGSLNLKAGDVLPVGLTLSGAWEREDTGSLAQRYDGKYLRGDVLVPVSPTLALEGGVGYEHIVISQKLALLDAGGAPVTDDRGSYVAAPGPRHIAYDTDGLIYDAGVVWRPSPRTSLEAHVGKRYGDVSYGGLFTWAASPAIGVQIDAYDDVETFAQQLQHGLAGLPTSFTVGSDPFAQAFGGCTFGTQSTAPGGCLNGVFQSIATASYRARGVDAIVSMTRGPWRTGVGVGYANRHFYAPDEGTGFTVDGVSDQSVYGELFADRALDSVSNLQGDVYVNYYDSGIAGARGVWGTGATGTYDRSIGRIDASASLGLFAYGAEDQDNDVSAQALLGMRYSF